VRADASSGNYPRATGLHGGEHLHSVHFRPCRELVGEAKSANLHIVKQLASSNRAIETGRFPIDSVDKKLVRSRLAPVNIASGVILITARRLSRRLCACMTPDNIPTRGAARTAATGATSGFAGSCRSRKRPTASPYGGNAAQITEQARREGYVRPVPIGPAQGQIGNDFAPGSHGLHQRVK